MKDSINFQLSNETELSKSDSLIFAENIINNTQANELLKELFATSNEDILKQLLNENQ